MKPIEKKLCAFSYDEYCGCDAQLTHLVFLTSYDLMYHPFNKKRLATLRLSSAKQGQTTDIPTSTSLVWRGRELNQGPADSPVETLTTRATDQLLWAIIIYYDSIYLGLSGNVLYKRTKRRDGSPVIAKRMGHRALLPSHWNCSIRDY